MTDSGEKMGSELLAETLQAYGVTHFFYEPVIVPIAIRHMTARGITPVMTHGEKAAAYMADGYARAAGRPGVCGSQAIGVSNLAAGLRDAKMAFSSVVALTGGPEPSTANKHFYQELDDFESFTPVTKFNARLGSAERIPDLLGQAFWAATTGAPGPTHLELAGFYGGVVDAPVSAELRADERVAVVPAYRSSPAETLLTEALSLITAAKKPVIVAGGGVVRSGAQRALVAFAEATNVPVATSLNGLGAVPGDHPLSVGVVGDYSRTSGNKTVYAADLVIFIGTATGGLTTKNWVIPALGTPVVHLDINPEVVGRNYDTAVALVGDARATLEKLSEHAPEGAKRSAWHAEIAAFKKEWRTALGDLLEEREIMAPQRLMSELSQAFPEDGILVADTGHSGAWVAQHFSTASAQQEVYRAAGSLGWGYPASLGVKCARPDRPVICFTGDGGFYYHLTEMETARRYGINTVTVVNNNGSLNQEKPIWSDIPEFEKNWVFEPVDIAGVARAMGCAAERVETPDAFREVFNKALAASEPFVIEAVTDKNLLSPPAWIPSEPES